jgi:transposase-like protein
MRQKSEHSASVSERIVKNIRRATRKRHSSEEKIRIVLDGLRGEFSIAELCRRHCRTPTPSPRSFWRPANGAWRAAGAALHSLSIGTSGPVERVVTADGQLAKAAKRDSLSMA